MPQAIKPLVHAGDAISHRVGPVIVALSCVRPDHAYRVSVQRGSTGAEIGELSKSHPTEGAARAAARGLCRIFTVAVRVEDVLAVLAELDALAVAA
jgi:hypothetical protein